MLFRRLVEFAAYLAVVVTFASTAPGYLDAAAAYRMALRHHHPLSGARPNYSRALLLYCRADGDDYADAAFAIGLMYAGGQGVRRSDARAKAWFLRARALGHIEAGKLLKTLRLGGGGRVARCPNGWGRGGGVKARLRAPDDIARLVEKMAKRYHVDPKLVLAVIAVESDFQANAVSSKNARGLMQLIPATAKRFGVRDAMDPVDNLRGGMSYLRWLLTHFKGDVTLALAAYNAGEGAVKRYGGVPPYRETRNYVRKIRRLYPAKKHPY